jgi:hypothetical protein
VVAQEPPTLRSDGGHRKVRRPKFLDAQQEPSAPASDKPLQPEIESPESSVAEAAVADSFDAGLLSVDKETLASESVAVSESLALVTDDSAEPKAKVLGTVAIDPDAEGEEEESRKARPAAWLASAVAHVAILIALAAFSLNSHRPKDQVALSGSAAEANEVSMETFSIETTELVTEVSEETPAEAELDLSPVGELAASKFEMDGPPAPPSQAIAAMSSSSVSKAAAMTLKSDSTAKMQFCGVDGGGNHFVYLVDSSGSMGDAFESARRELLASIDLLKPDQRFYVVFFDTEPDYMRLSDPNTDEPRSVNATPQNKAALRSWARRIKQDFGRAPKEPIKFALNLKPDVIFLLSDGEFPQSFEDLVKEENRVENLFGDSHPISIIHTIGYHSKEGESRMRRIAKQYNGQYRHVPKP